jgi:hypothetical protein
MFVICFHKQIFGLTQVVTAFMPVFMPPNFGTIDNFFSQEILADECSFLSLARCYQEMLIMLSFIFQFSQDPFRFNQFHILCIKADVILFIECC